MPLSNIACAGCSRSLLSVTGGHPTPGLALWLEKFLPSCKRAFYKECLNDWIDFYPQCPHCGERTLPASWHLMKPPGTLKKESGKKM